MLELKVFQRIKKEGIFRQIKFTGVRVYGRV